MVYLYSTTYKVFQGSIPAFVRRGWERIREPLVSSYVALVLTVKFGVELHLANGNKHLFVCVWLIHAFVRSDFVEVSSGIRTYLRMLFTHVLMLFAVK